MTHMCLIVPILRTWPLCLLKNNSVWPTYHIFQYQSLTRQHVLLIVFLLSATITSFNWTKHCYMIWISEGLLNLRLILKRFGRDSKRPIGPTFLDYAAKRHLVELDVNNSSSAKWNSCWRKIHTDYQKLLGPTGSKQPDFESWMSCQIKNKYNDELDKDVLHLLLVSIYIREIFSMILSTKLWNNLHSDLQCSKSICRFKSHYKRTLYKYTNTWINYHSTQ